MWRGDHAENRADLLRAQRRIEEKLGVGCRALPPIPTANGTAQFVSWSAELGFTAAFGQHSGVVAAHSDRLNLPRFALNASYGDIDRFRLIVDTLPLGARNVTPTDQIMVENPPTVGFTIKPPLANRASLACYASGGVDATLDRKDGGRVEVQFGPALPNRSGPAQLHRPRRGAGAGTGSGFSSWRLRASPSLTDSATGRDRGPPLLRRPRGGAGRRPAAVVSDKIRERFRVARIGFSVFCLRTTKLFDSFPFHGYDTAIFLACPLWSDEVGFSLSMIERVGRW